MNNNKKQKTIIIVLSILLLFMFWLVVFQHLKTYSEKEVKEREELLVSVVREINIPQKDIDEIVVLSSKASEPFNYNVAINMKNGKQILYTWKDNSKNEVEKLN